MRRYLHLVAALTLGSLAILQIVSCAADPSDSSGTAADGSKSTSAAPGAKMPAATPESSPAASSRSSEAPATEDVRSYPPDRSRDRPFVH
jgi:hypothetical protein